MKVISKIKVFIKDVLWLGMVNKFLYGPRKTLPFSEIVKRSNEIRVHEVIPAIKSNLMIEKDLIAATNTPEIRDYKPEIIINPTLVAEIKNGRLMTDGSDIAIMTSDRLLLEHFSVHYEIEAGNRAFGAKIQERNNLFNRKYYHPPKKINGTVLNMQTGGGGLNYWHFLVDTLPGYYIAEKSGLLKGIDYYYFQNIDKNFQKEALKALNIELDRVITNEDTLHFKADRLITFTHPNVRFHMPMWIIEFLRNKFLTKITPNKKQFSKIFISRKDSLYGRYIVNEDEIFAKLEPLGFKRLILSEFSFLDGIMIFNSADIVISLHGSGLTNLVFCNPGTNVIEIFPEDYIQPELRCISSRLSLNYHYFITKLVADGKHKYSYSPVIIEEEKLFSVLKKIGIN